jgi:hypothetical protein
LAKVTLVMWECKEYVPVFETLTEEQKAAFIRGEKIIVPERCSKCFWKDEKPEDLDFNYVCNPETRIEREPMCINYQEKKSD